MLPVRHALFSALVLSVAGGDLAAQEPDRLWASVETVSGETYRGFLRWDRAQTGRSDLLTGTRGVSRENQRIWRIATGRGSDLPRRVVEVAGFRVSWNEDDPDFPSAASAGIRFGHIRELRPTGSDAATVILNSGAEIALTGGGTHIGRDIREILVEVPGGPEVSLEWEDLARVLLDAPPADAVPSSPRLHGTVTDRWGNRYTGYVAWDRTLALAGDVLAGGGAAAGIRDELRFSEVALLEWGWDGMRATMVDGEVLDLPGAAVAGRDRGVRVSDPGLGRVEVAWDDLESLRLHPAKPGDAAPAFDGGRPLRATVSTRAGADFTGRVLWDADEEATWQVLDGERRGVRFQVEFGEIESVERLSSREARVTLRDGRTLELEGSNDVGEGNRGILVLPDGDDDWIVVPWDEFHVARFEHE